MHSGKTSQWCRALKKDAGAALSLGAIVREGSRGFL